MNELTFLKNNIKNIENKEIINIENKSSAIKIQEYFNEHLFDRLLILFENEEDSIINNSIYKLWLLNDGSVYIYEWSKLSISIQRLIIKNLEYQFEKCLIYNDDFQKTSTIKCIGNSDSSCDSCSNVSFTTNESLNILRCSPTIGYRPINRKLEFNESDYHPSLVIEIGINQSLSDLFEKSEFYLKRVQNIRLVLILKFWFYENTSNYSALAILLNKRNYNNNKNHRQIELISFGNTPIGNKSIEIIKQWYGCGNDITIKNSNSTQLELPLSELYHNVDNGNISKNQKLVHIDLNILKRSFN